MTDAMTPLDSGWIAANPAPVHGNGTTKNSRGRVLAIGGSRMVPGALRLTGEAALRVGAGKLQMATVASAATMLGLLVPEAAAIALPEDDDGEIAADAGRTLETAIDGCDALVIGPGIGSPAVAARLLHLLVGRPRDDMAVVIDAMAIGCARDVRDGLAAFAGRLVLTPHHGEMAILTGRDEGEIAADPATIAAEVAATYGAIVVLKGSDTVIAAPGDTPLHYGGGGTGLEEARADVR